MCAFVQTAANSFIARFFFFLRGKKDDNNVAAIMEAAEHWGKADLAAKKTRSLLSYCTAEDFVDVETIPNPYFAGRNVSSNRSLHSNRNSRFGHDATYVLGALVLFWGGHLVNLLARQTAK